MKGTVGIVILNFNGREDTVQLLESIWDRVKGVSYSLIVVDNASEGGDAEYLEKAYGDRITVLRSPRNLGYAAGNNIGLRYAFEHGMEYLCILNNDAIITEDFFPACLNYLDSHPDTAFVSPAIVGRDGLIQNTGGHLNLLKCSSYQINAGLRPEQVTQDEISCDMVYGACIVLRRETLSLAGYLPEAYFLFYEETEWCYRAKKKGMHSVCLAKHSLIHKGSVSVWRLGGIQGYLMERNRVVFAKRNLGPLRFPAFLLFDLARTVYRCFSEKVSLATQLKYIRDGLTGAVDPKYSFIWINETDEPACFSLFP